MESIVVLLLSAVGLLCQLEEFPLMDVPCFKMVTRPPLEQISSNSNFQKLLPVVLWPLLTFRLPLRFDKEANKHGLLGCGMVSIETTIWTV